MLRNKAPAQLQKTYDESYLSCSKAVYYESQGNEPEAMRCWRTALDQIRGQAPGRDFGGSNSETETALWDSLRELEIQCQERIDLLEALRLSRQDESATQRRSPETNSRASQETPESPNIGQGERGWIGQGTIPAITYPELARPILPPRPPLPPRSSDSDVVASTRSSLTLTRSQSPKVSTNSSPTMVGKDKTFRSNSPEKHKMRTTLRQNKGEKPARLTRNHAVDVPEGPSKAATLAWSALTSRESPSRRPLAEPIATAASPSPGVRTRPSQPRNASTSSSLQWDSNSRRLVGPGDHDATDTPGTARRSEEYSPSPLSISAASSALNALSYDLTQSGQSNARADGISENAPSTPLALQGARASKPRSAAAPDTGATGRKKSVSDGPIRRKPVASTLPGPNGLTFEIPDPETKLRSRQRKQKMRSPSASSGSDVEPGYKNRRGPAKTRPEKHMDPESADESPGDELESTWKKRRAAIMKNLPPGVDEAAARSIMNDIVVQGDEVRWTDIAGLEIAKNALRENVVYPFLRPDLFMGLREPARGILLFGPPGTGKTMLARAVATESRSTFFSISASSLTSKYLGESEKLVRALFALAKALAPSIIFVDEIDSLLSQRSGSGEHEATRRIKTEFLIQWSDLQRAAAGRDVSDKDRERGDASRVLVLAATNLPWAIDEAARRRFVRRQYIPLPEPKTRETQLRTLLGQQKHTLTNADIERLVGLTDGFSGSDITALAKDAAMGPLRSLGEALLHMTMEDIRPIELADFTASLATIRPSVSKTGLKEYEDWAKEFGERGG